MMQKQSLYFGYGSKSTVSANVKWKQAYGSAFLELIGDYVMSIVDEPEFAPEWFEL